MEESQNVQSNTPPEAAEVLEVSLNSLMKIIMTCLRAMRFPCVLKFSDIKEITKFKTTFLLLLD